MVIQVVSDLSMFFVFLVIVWLGFAMAVFVLEVRSMLQPQPLVTCAAVEAMRRHKVYADRACPLDRTLLRLTCPLA